MGGSRTLIFLMHAGCFFFPSFVFLDFHGLGYWIFFLIYRLPGKSVDSLCRMLFFIFTIFYNFRIILKTLPLWTNTYGIVQKQRKMLNKLKLLYILNSSQHSWWNFAHSSQPASWVSQDVYLENYWFKVNITYSK